MRKGFPGTILALLASLTLAGAQTPGKGSTSGTTLETVSVSRESGGGINIEITTKNETTPWVETLADPVRIVVDLPNTVLATRFRPILVETNGVMGVRIGTDAFKTTRVVVDLTRLCKYELVPGSGHRLILKLDPNSPLPALAAEGGASATPGAPVQSAAPSLSPPSQSAPGNVVAASGTTTAEPASVAQPTNAVVQASTEVVHTQPSSTAAPGQGNVARPAPATGPSAVSAASGVVPAAPAGAPGGNANTASEASNGGVLTARAAQVSSTAASAQPNIAQPAPASSPVAPVLNANGAGPGVAASVAARGTTLETVRVSRESGSGISIEITTKDETAPWVETLPDPARIVVDLPNTVFKTGLGPIVIGTNGVKGVRIGTDVFKTTRVVVDLTRLCKYELVPGSGHRLILKLDPNSPAPAVEGGVPVQSASLPSSPSQSPPPPLKLPAIRNPLPLLLSRRGQQEPAPERARQARGHGSAGNQTQQAGTQPQPGNVVTAPGTAEPASVAQPANGGVQASNELVHTQPSSTAGPGQGNVARLTVPATGPSAVSAAGTVVPAAPAGAPGSNANTASEASSGGVRAARAAPASSMAASAQPSIAQTAPASSPVVPVSSANGAGASAAASVPQVSPQPAIPTSNAKAVPTPLVAMATGAPQPPPAASASSHPSTKAPTAAIPVPSIPPSTPESFKKMFNIKYVAEDAVYIEGGKDAGLVAGMILNVQRMNPAAAPPTNAGTDIAEVAVVSVSNTSAVCEIRSKTSDLERGDVALLSQADQQKLEEASTLGPSRKYPQVIAFSEGDPLDEELRESVPQPPLPEVNRARGRIGIDYTLIHSSGATPFNTSQIGGVIRMDMTRIGGSYWNLNGYWRGNYNAIRSSNQAQSVYDLVNRTYTLGFTYMNPHSPWTAGVGRLYLPWATSLDTFDGGYIGHRVGQYTTVGAFAGTSADPISFNYNPDRRTAGSFVAFEAGSFEGLRFTSTEGIAVSSIGWREDRQFLFNETGLFYKRFFSVYNASQADKQHLPTGGIEQGLSRSFSTLRLQPVSFLSFDLNHNYFRDVPTFSASLISTGLLDKFLFQGVSAGARVELPGHIALYGDFGRSNRSGDAHNSLNQLYGITLGRLGFTGVRADVRYSKFTSSFGSGDYRAATLSRSFKEILRLEVDAGKQNFLSSLSTPTDYRLLGSTVDLNLGAHYFFETTFNVQRGTVPGITRPLSPLPQNFNQWFTTMGYRFDTKRGK